jgi:Fe2+ or Zn2+ uptake regulation protein
MATRSPHPPSPPADAWIERAEAALRGAGYRSSAPRSAVLELIGRQDCVLSAREIADELRSGGRHRI